MGPDDSVEGLQARDRTSAIEVEIKDRRCDAAFAQRLEERREVERALYERLAE